MTLLVTIYYYYYLQIINQLILHIPYILLGTSSSPDILTDFLKMSLNASQNQGEAFPMHKHIPFHQRKSVLIKFSIILGLSIVAANGFVISLVSYFPGHFYSITVVSLNVTACIASVFGVITVYRYGIRGIHGQSLLFLTLGIIGWFLADLTLAYGHFVFLFEEEQSFVVSFADVYWIIGYVFLSLHLFSVLRLVKRTQIHALTIIAVIIICGFSITHSMIFSSEFLMDADEILIVGETRTGFIDRALSVLYVVLDLIFIIPSVIILTASRKDYYEFIPWILFSLSLLTNAIADEGFKHDFVEGNTSGMWTWDLFYMTDYIILAGAFYWYNRFHSTMKIVT